MRRNWLPPQLPASTGPLHFPFANMRTAALITLVILACLALPSAPVFADDPPDGAGKQGSVVSPLLQQFIERRHDAAGQGGQPSANDGATSSLPSSDVAAKDAAAGGTVGSGPSEARDAPVRFDSSGNVQVYIHLENTDDTTLQELRDLGATIEITNSDGNVVQAWVPVLALDDIGAWMPLRRSPLRTTV